MTRAKFSSMFIATFWQGRALRGLALRRRRRDIDLYLIALVLYIFSFGIYELFISEIEGLKQSKQSPRNALARRTQG